MTATETKLSLEINPLLSPSSLTSIECLALDLSSHSSTVQFSEKVKQKLGTEGHLDVLLLGAGIVKGRRERKDRGKWGEDLIVNYIG